jgi:hypothetical protein
MAMRQTRFAVLAVVVLTPVLVATAQAGPRVGHGKEMVVQQGKVFCPSTALIYGNIVVQPGRCYTLAVLRNTQGTFLAFAEPGIRIPPGQLVRLTTPAGAKLKGRIFYLVPIQTTAVLVPVNAVTLLPVRVVDEGPRVSLTIISTLTPNLTVIFNAQVP